MDPQEYDITSGGYYWRGRQNLEAYRDMGAKPNLFYSAFEFRCCIERILKEYLLLVHTVEIPRSLYKMYRAKELGATILEVEPFFFEKLEYIDIMFEAIGVPNRVFVPDLALLNRLYGRLGNYLHAQNEPEETVNIDQWWQEFMQIVEETEAYIRTIQGHDFGSIELNDRGLEIFNKWQGGEITREQALGIIRDDFRGK